MKKIVQLSIVCLQVGFAAASEIFTVGDYKYERTGYQELKHQNGSVKIGWCRLVRCVNEVPEAVIPRNVDLGGYSCCVTGVVDNAFSDNKTLKTVTIPSGCSIGNSAFRNCSALIAVYGNLSNVVDSDGSSLASPSIGDYAFQNCTSLTNITFLDDDGETGSHKLKSIGKEAFRGCCSLVEMAIPSSVEWLGSGTFNGCTGLVRVTINDGLMSHGSSYGDGYLSDSLFRDCTSLQCIIIPQNVRYIGDYTFHNCQSLKSVNLPDNLEVIGYRTFDGCLSLTTIEIPSKVTEVGILAFGSCGNLKSARVPASAALGNHAFPTACTLLFSAGEGGDAVGVGSWNGYKTKGIPEAPMDVDAHVAISPTTQAISQSGGGAAILTKGTGIWSAAASHEWIRLNATEGTVGNPVAYIVDVNTNVEQRTGFVYVSGRVHTITQEGCDSSISPASTTFDIAESAGGNKVTTATVNVTAPAGMCWQARSDVDWLWVDKTCGIGNGSVTCWVYGWEYGKVYVRTGTLTIAGKTFQVTQYGERMLLDKESDSCDYCPHTFLINIEALSDTEWSVSTHNSDWLSVVDAGSGRGSGTVTIAAGENPSYKAREGVVYIGSKRFAVTQSGRTELDFAASPMSTTASMNGANGLVSVTATPGLPWSAATDTSWLTLYNNTGSGNGNLVFVAAPNSTLCARTGYITITPDAASGVVAKKISVRQPAQESTLSSAGFEFIAIGEATTVDVTVADYVEWNIVNNLDWIAITSDTSYIGPATVTIAACVNDSVYPRTGTIEIAGKKFTVTQKARGVELEYDNIVFDANGQPKNGGVASFYVHPDANVSWTAVASDPSWIVLFGATSGTGDGTVTYVVAPYVGDGTPRTGTITVGDKVVYVTQRAYDLMIDPCAQKVDGDAGAGEISVTASIGDVWAALVTAPWITIVSGYDSGTGSGTVRFEYTDNDTGKTRIGKIVISGEAYTLTQTARVLANVSVKTDNGGSAIGGGSYRVGSEIILTAQPSEGYVFKCWDGDISSTENPLVATVDSAMSVKAVFVPLTPDIVFVSNSVDGVSLVWTNLAWALKYNIYRSATSSHPNEALVSIVADGTHSYFDAAGDVGVPYWYWVEAIGAVDTNECVNPVSGKKLKPIIISNITYENLRGTTHTNPTTYQEETVVAFDPPKGAVIGYTFTGWTPNGITSEMTGDQLVTANWTANSYEVMFYANGGSGTMANQPFTYDVGQALTANAFAREGYKFIGWGRDKDSVVVWTDGEVVSNLTAVANGVVELYAVWESVGGGEEPGGGDEPEVHEPPTDWEPVTKEDTMIVYVVVSNKQTKACIESDGSLLAAFAADGECRGKVAIGKGPKGKLYSLSVGIKSVAEKGFSFRVWDAATGEITEIKDTLDCNAEKKYGALKTPIVFTIGTEECELTLKAGWNWISTPLKLDDDSVGAALAGFTFADDDVIKSSGAMATYCEGEWYPSDFKVEPGKAYMVYKSTGGEETVTREGESVSATIEVKAGWNWIGATLAESLTVAEVVHSGGFVDDDVFKSSSEFTTYCEGEWYPGEFTFVPGVGYKACLANAGTLCFGNEPGTKQLSVAGVSPRLCAADSATCPNWEQVTKEDTISVYLQLSNDVDKTWIEAADTTVAAFAANGECRGVAKVMDGPKCRLFQLSVGVASKLESGITLKVWDAAAHQVYEVAGTIAGNETGKIGTLKAPYVMIAEVPKADPIPELEDPKPEEIKDVLEQATDAKLATEITNATEYAEFRDWADKVKDPQGETAAGAAGVMASEHAWMSYALGTEKLLEKAPTDADLKVEEFKPTAKDGKFDFTVSVKDVEVGSEASKDNLKKIFGLEGSTGLSGFSADKVEIDFGVPENGNVKFTAGPKDTDAKTFFMKVKIAP